MSSFDSDRAFLEVTGDDRIAFLQGLLTQDVTLLAPDTLLFAALLTPQGKLAHDFFVFAHHDAIVLDTAAATKDALLKRLTLYKLRAKVTLRDANEWRVSYIAQGGLADPRHPDMPQRSYTTEDCHPGPRSGAGVEAAHGAAEVPVLLSQTGMTAQEYHTRRLSLGIPESPRDTTQNDVAMDLAYDLLGAISFTKGCYVGQEVTARMHYKNIARKGFYLVEAASALPAAGTPIHAGDLAVGTLRGSVGTRGLALLKFGEVEHAALHAIPLTVENSPVTVTLAPWLAPKLAQFRATHENQ